MVIYLFEPILGIFKTLDTGAIVGENDPVCPLVVGLGDISKSLLAGGVPDLDLGTLAHYGHGLNLEIDA